MIRILVILVTVLIAQSVCAASLKPVVPPNERAVYAEMLKTNPTAAKEYLITREYMSQCRQVVANPKLAIDLPDEPDDFNSHYVSKDESKMMKKAIIMALGAYINKKGGLK
jgi:hypothetical protein